MTDPFTEAQAALDKIIIQANWEYDASEAYGLRSGQHCKATEATQDMIQGSRVPVELLLHLATLEIAARRRMEAKP